MAEATEAIQAIQATEATANTLTHPFPSIEAFRHLSKQVGYVFHDQTVPETLEFLGTVKLHGTHADIMYENGAITVQSRNRLIFFPLQFIHILLIIFISFPVLY